jgi:hypothetical protein
MKTNSDWTALLRELNAVDARYLVVGAHAVILYTRPRGTIDFDVWVARDLENAKRVYRALANFGAPLDELSVEDLLTDDLVFQIGREPNRIDIITDIDGVDFEDAWLKRAIGDYGEARALFISKEHLIENKRAAGREKDLIDLRALEAEEPEEA